MNFKQCALSRLARDDRNYRIRQVTWLPEQFAKVGMVLDLRDREGEWEEGWRVDDVWTTATEEYVREHERDYKHQAEVGQDHPEQGTEDRRQQVKRMDTFDWVFYGTAIAAGLGFSGWFFVALYCLASHGHVVPGIGAFLLGAACVFFSYKAFVKFAAHYFGLSAK